MDREREGELFAVATMLIIGATPVLVKVGAAALNPIFFAGIMALGGALALFPFALRAGISQLFSKKHALHLFLISMLASGAAMLTFVVGASMTSAINASILLQVEVLYSMLISYLILREKITGKQVLFSFLIVLGTIIVIYNGTAAINLGDLLVLAAPIFYQLSHMISKGLIREVDPAIISFARAAYAGIILTPIALFLFPSQPALLLRPDILAVVVVQALLGYALGFFLWYSALGRINLSKATGLIMPNPLISVALAMLWLGETPSVYQIAGFLITMLGIYLLTKVKSERR